MARHRDLYEFVEGSRMRPTNWSHCLSLHDRDYFKILVTIHILTGDARYLTDIFVCQFMRKPHALRLVLHGLSVDNCSLELLQDASVD